MDGSNGRIRHAAEYVTRVEGRFGSFFAQMGILGEVESAESVIGCVGNR